MATEKPLLAPDTKLLSLLLLLLFKEKPSCWFSLPLSGESDPGNPSLNSVAFKLRPLEAVVEMFIVSVPEVFSIEETSDDMPM
jgi:hypothetical protein